MLPDLETIRRELARLSDSSMFRNSINLQRFIEFVVEETLAGRSDRIKESLIAISVFRRSTDFDPRLDSIVRVQATLVRRKLAAYYQAEGANSEIRIEFPKPGYVPRFVGREVAVAVSQPAARTGRLPRLRVRSRVAVAAGILLAGLGYLGFRSAHAADASTIWEPFFQAGARNAIVYGTPQFFSLDGLYLRDVNVNSPEDVKSDSRIGAVHRAISGDSQILAPDAPILYTGIGEAFGGQKMLRYFWEHSQHPETLLNSEADGRGMRDANLVVIASMRFRTLLDELQFPSDFTRIDGPGGNGEAILNSKPAASESKIYYSHRPAHSTQEVEYALVSLWPWRGGNHRVLLLSGTNTYATEAAVDFVTDPASLAQLERRLRAAGHPRYFQCLLRVFEVGTHVARVEYVTHHALPDPAPMVTAARGPSIKGIAP